MAPWSIAAVAIGTAPDQHIATETPTRVRQYIPGLIKGLSQWYTIGTHYVIEYRERTESDLNNAASWDGIFAGDLIFCMSSTVVRAAQSYTSDVPIVGIVSDPGPKQKGGEDFDRSTNICGVSAQRHQKAADCLNKFCQATDPPLENVIALHKPGYNPSEQALGHVKGMIAGTLEARNDFELTLRLNNLERLNAGLFVLPADLFFARGWDIINAAHSEQVRMPTFFFAPDWVPASTLPSALCGFGVSQFRCGELLAERVHFARQNRVPLPSPRFTTAQGSDFEWWASTAAANALGIKLSAAVPQR